MRKNDKSSYLSNLPKKKNLLLYLSISSLIQNHITAKQKVHISFQNFKLDQSDLKQLNQLHTFAHPFSSSRILDGFKSE